MGWGKKIAATTGIVVMFAVGYGIADAYDIVPGKVTLAPPYPTPNPFPTEPGAVAPPPLTKRLAPFSTAEPEPSAAVLQRLLDDLAADRRLGSRVGAMIVDLATGAPLAERAADVPLVPASTMKLLTAAAALAALGPDLTLVTTAVLDGDALTLIGGGDMMLAADTGDPQATNGRAGLGDLAQQVADQLALRGTDAVAVRVDDSLFTGPAISPAWHPDNVPLGYAAPVTALAVNIARLGPQEYAQRAVDPSLHAAEAFAAALGARGIAVTEPVRRAGAAPGAALLGQVESAPLRDVVTYLLQHSDNTISEVVGRIVAIHAGLPGSAEGAPQAVFAAIQALGVDLTGASIADCSGLGDGSMLTPHQLVQVVQLLNDPAHPTLRWAAIGLPIAGYSGTLSERYLESAGRGVVRAKTGSLPGVTSLAGTVVTRDNRLLAFALMGDDAPSTYAARQIFDALVATVAECGCSE